MPQIAFSLWFGRLQAERWDKQIEGDARSGGKLDQLADDAMRDHRAGRTFRL
ncbi:hypothetical protein GGQ64_004164 [Rhizobium azooxidifex]|uniref:Uncharacterized protein n=1 Tax=Mycoplana azooxidifex TaxID=1636188 RepID=A0A7W6DFL8_9HYPH|nr:hypothetical protein [Mycoplana azooxidifex]MBB3978928.1 hypothetical protein [Mycoplana azooxidifex]